MNIKELQAKFNLSNEIANRMQEYWEKAQNAEIIYCEDCTGEYFDFEAVNGECPRCVGT